MSERKRPVVPGDIVMLASGSAELTVMYVLPEKGEGTQELCRCVYYADGKFIETLIPSVALVHVKGTDP